MKKFILAISLIGGICLPVKGGGGIRYHESSSTQTGLPNK